MSSSTPNQPIQNYEIVNPTLEQQVANLLPSVAGYGGNLRSTNTIIPIVDLTAAAEGTTLPQTLQQAIAFGSQTAFEINNTTTNLANTPGFWRVTAGYTNFNTSSGDINCAFNMTDGASTKVVWKNRLSVSSSLQVNGGDIDLIFFLPAGITLSGTAGIYSYLSGSYRQVADINANLTDPAGFF